MADTIKNITGTVTEKVKNIDFNLQGNIVVIVLVGIVLLWMLSIISPTFIILFIVALNIYSLYFLYSKDYIEINYP
jgi:hypothetical protein